jgi:glyoxylase-like metal-dependent hydrolase (beta-lactamase superfamily II)
VFAVFPDDAAAKNADGVPVATSGGFVVGKDGVLVVDTMLNRRLARQLLALVAAATSKPIRYVVNTSYHGDHSYGNQFLPNGTQVIQHVATQRYIRQHFTDDVAFMKQYFGTNQGLDELRPQPAQLLLHDEGVLDVDLGDKQVTIMHLGFAQTPGDLFVWVPDQRVLFTGNPIVAKPPAIPWLLEGHLHDVVATLHKLRNVIPDDAIVVPGHGAPVDVGAIEYSIRYLEQLSTEVTSAVRRAQSEHDTVATVQMKEYAAYRIFPWVHSQINVPTAYRELKEAR